MIVTLVAVGYLVFTATGADPGTDPEPTASDPEQFYPDPDDASGKEEGGDQGPDDEAASDPEPADGPAQSEPTPVTAADTLPVEDAQLLGTVIEIRTSDLRYHEGEIFDSYFYRCLFTAHLENHTDVEQEFEMQFGVPHVPDQTWSGSPTTVEPGERKRLGLGWETASLDDLGITEAECTGEVELLALAANPG